MSGLFEILIAHDIVPVEDIRVLWPVIFMATLSGVPDLTSSLTILPLFLSPLSGS